MVILTLCVLGPVTVMVLRASLVAVAASHLVAVVASHQSSIRHLSRPLPQLGVIQSLFPLHSIVSSAKPFPSLGQCLSDCMSSDDHELCWKGVGQELEHLKKSFNWVHSRRLE
ncbi:hypothetical protein IMY05_002G0037900 [Salix suchowensis]|nr:hypothetical protein IMY05_002G0037900 [Salix suchowensis]